MANGDDNTKKIQAFVKGIKQQNTIWEIRNENNEWVSTFEEMVEIGKSYFENIFRADQHATIVEVLQVMQYFHERISEEDNSDLMEEVSEEELKATLHNFQKDKSPGIDRWTIEFFLATYDTIGPDLLHLVE